MNLLNLNFQTKEFMNYKIGIGITTTPNRKVLDLTEWHKYFPNNFMFTVYEDKDFKGIAFAKNKLLNRLQSCEHIFLADDDVIPLRKDWYLPYIEHPEPHLMYQFRLPGKPLSEMKELYRDDKTVAYSRTRGVFLYIERRVLDVVGGFDEEYGRYGYEHPDWTNRIHNAGLTTHRAMDVPNSHELLYCIDQDYQAESSVPEETKRIMMAKNYKYYKSQRGSKEYKDFRHESLA